jgi:hypothetical protein
MRPASYAEVWDELRRGQIVAGEPPDPPHAQAPWYVRTMLGIAGWVAAAFALLFVGAAFGFIVRSPVASIVTGAIMIAAAYGLFRGAGTNDFAAQVGIAASFAGQALIAYGILSGSRDAARWFMVAAIEATLVLALPNVVHRVWSAYAAGTAATIGLAAAGGHFLSAGLLCCAVAVVWLNEFAAARRGSLVRSLGYGLTLALIQAQASLVGRRGLMDVFDTRVRPEWLPSWVGEALPGVVLIAVVYRLLARANGDLPQSSRFVPLVAAVVVAAVSVQAPGIATGLTIVVVGYANGNRTLTGLGIIALLVYVSAYYYMLDLTLLAKSAALAVTGAVLLMLRWAFASERLGHA